ncbi:MAG: nickel pincer cofactor biosynthesis protein LarC [Pirellulaceae bacterium]
MRVAYLDCSSGISGDMTLGALVDAGIPLQEIQQGIDSLGLPECRLEASEVKKKGFRATHIRVLYAPEHKHRHLHHITAMIQRSSLSVPQQELAHRIFARLGEAEAKVHGTTVEKVHFHEVGAVDSIADIVGTAIAWQRLDVDRVVCSPVPTGQGTVNIAHGRVSVPAPATAELLTGIPLAPSEVQAELTTPTGAAIVATLATDFGGVPAMRIRTIGYGAGTRDLDEQPNLLRLLVGESDELSGDTGWQEDQVWVLETNLDDVPGEWVAYCAQCLLEAGALDVYATPIQMKKNRPGLVLSVLCQAADIVSLEQIIFSETGSLGIRRWPARRHTLERRTHEVTTPWGNVVGKLARLADGTTSFSPEFESCRQLASSVGRPLREVYRAAQCAFDLSASRLRW